MIEIKKLVLIEAGHYDPTEEDIVNAEAVDLLTENEARNGHICVWYLDERQNICYDTVEHRFLTPEEIDKQFC
jgi:hypothetical protein